MRALLKAFCGLAVLAAWCGAHDFELSPTQREELRSAVSQFGGGVDGKQLSALAKVLTSFTPAELRHLEHAPQFTKLPGHIRGALGRAVRSLAFARTHQAYLRDPWEIAYLMGSETPRDWLAGIRLLRRQPLDGALEQIAVTLSTDPRPEVRLGAGRLAKMLTVLRGPSEKCEAVARRVLVDRVPNVAAMFATFDAHEFQRGTIRLLVARLEDSRRLGPASGVLRGTGTVSEHVHMRLSEEFFWWRYDLPVDYKVSRDAITAWWKRHGGQYESGPEPAKWRRILEWRGTCEVGRKTKVRTDDGPVWLEVRKYEEHWFGDKPVYTALVAVWRDTTADAPWLSFGPKANEDGEGVRSESSDESSRRRGELLMAPDSKGRIRMRARIWVKEKEGGH